MTHKVTTEEERPSSKELEINVCRAIQELEDQGFIFHISKNEDTYVSDGIDPINSYIENYSMISDLRDADLKDSYEIHWASVLCYAKLGDKRICPNCNDMMEVSEDNWKHWECNECGRIEYLATIDENEKRLSKPYWFIDCSKNKKVTSKGRFWE